MNSTSQLLIPTLLLGSLLAGASANADTTLTFDRETTGSLRGGRPGGFGGPSGNAARPGTNAKQIVTVRMKGTKARVEFRNQGAAPETPPTAVLLYDGTAQKVYTLDMTAKTFYVQSFREAIDGERRQADPNAGGLMGGMTMNASVDIKAARERNEFVSKEVAGVASRQYFVGGTVAMQFNAPAADTVVADPPIPPDSNVAAGGGAMGSVNTTVQAAPPSSVTVTGPAPGPGQGRRRWQGGGGPGGAGFTPPSLAVDGEVWSTDGAALFTTGRETPVAAIYRLMIPDNAGLFGGSLTKPLVARLKSMKSLPRESTISLRMSFNFGGNNADPNSASAPAADPLTTHLTIKEMKTDAALDDALFAPPADYKQAEAPTPGFGGRGGGGWGERGGQGGRGQRGTRGQSPTAPDVKGTQQP